MTAQQEFKELVESLVHRGIYPSPLAILTELGSRGTRRNLNGRQVRWRAEVLTQLGWKHRGDLSSRVTGVPKRRYQWERP